MTFLIIHLMVLGISLAIGPFKVEMIKRGIVGSFEDSGLVGLGSVTGNFK